MFGYTSIYDKSMNGIRTLTDGISIISDGVAQHENIIYSDYITSQDTKTKLINNKITTENIESINATLDDVMSLTINTDSLKSKNITIVDSSDNSIFSLNGTTQQFTLNGASNYYEPLTMIDTIIYNTQGTYIYQTGTNFNTLKDTEINGYLEVGSNLTQTGGSSVLKDLTVDNITMNTNKGITQTGTSTSNNFGTTTVSNLVITDSVTFPSSVTIPGTTTSDDIVMNSNSVITQDTTVTTTKFNIFRNTKTKNLDIDGNLTQTQAGSTTTLKNTIIQGSTTLQGDIEQTAGYTKLNTIECNNITLRTDNNLNISGSGIINQSGTGENIMNGITLNTNKNITFNGSGIISQPVNGINILSHFRSAGFGIIGGRNNTTYSHYQNIQNNNGLQMQYNRDNSTFYSYFLNNRTGAGGGFRFQRYNGGVYVDEPMTIDDNITFNKDVSIVGKSITASSATLGIITQTELDCLDNCNTNIKNKFNDIDTQLTNLTNTSGSISTSTTGITYNSTDDTTTVDNNLIISNSKILYLGSTNVNNFVSDINTFKTNTNNTLQGITYNSTSDTSTIDNNVEINKTLIVQGMNIKAEIDALDTSFTTGTITSTNATINNLTYQNLSTNANDGRITTSSGKVLYLNNDKTSGDITINSGSTSSNVNISNGHLNISNGNIYLSNGTLSTSGYVITNNLKFTNFYNSSSIQNFENTFDSVSQTKTNLTSNVGIAFTAATNANFNKKVIVNVPINVYCINGTLNTNGSSMMSIVESLTNVSCVVKKNNVTFASPSVSLTNSLPISKTYNVIASTSTTTFSYEQFFTNSSISFVPSFENAMNSYTVEFTLTYSRTITYANAPGVSASQSSTQNYYLNSNITTNTNSNTIIFSADGSNYNKSYSSLFEYSSISYPSISGGIQTNDLICKNLYTQTNIYTNNIISTTATINNINNTTTIETIKSPNYPIVSLFIGAYMLNGSRNAGYEWHPISCSQYHLRNPDNDDVWVVYPGYKIVIYANDGYGGSSYTINNYSGSSPSYVESSSANNANSVKLYYLNDSNEITNGLVS